MYQYLALLAVVVVLVLLAFYYYKSKEGYEGGMKPEEAAIEPPELSGSYFPYQYKQAKEARMDKQIELGLDAKSKAEAEGVQESLMYWATPSCPVGNEKDYSVEDYGGEKSYMDWVGDKLISPDMYRNHEEYVQNDISRLGTGRTISYDMHDSYDPIKWAGLYRPQRLPQEAEGTPDAIPDLDKSLYSVGPSILIKA